MWSMRQKDNGELFLTFDRDRRRTNNLRGTWEFIGRQGVSYTARAVEVNTSAGYYCLNDDEGGVRILVLEY